MCVFCAPLADTLIHSIYWTCGTGSMTLWNRQQRSSKPSPAQRLFKLRIIFGVVCVILNSLIFSVADTVSVGRLEINLVPLSQLLAGFPLAGSMFVLVVPTTWSEPATHSMRQSQSVIIIKRIAPSDKLLRIFGYKREQDPGPTEFWPKRGDFSSYFFVVVSISAWTIQWSCSS